jgi:hypothetical protein
MQLAGDLPWAIWGLGRGAEPAGRMRRPLPRQQKDPPSDCRQRLVRKYRLTCRVAIALALGRSDLAIAEDGRFRRLRDPRKNQAREARAEN